MDRISDKDRPSDVSYKDALAQPLKLRDSLKIRDGLGGHDARSVGWPQFKVTRLTVPALSFLWVSNN